MTNWLDQFAYRVTLTPGIFSFTSSAPIVITLLTISYQSITAALSNPVHGLRTDWPTATAGAFRGPIFSSV
jgi:putative ABC transport system permease protein